MKRDLMIVYRILEKVEECEYNANDPAPIPIVIPGVDQEEVQYHLLLLKEAGFIETVTGNTGILAPTRLTWAGHDHLDNASNIVIEGIDNVFAEVAGE